MYIDIGFVLSFNAFMTYVLGMRMGGKTYGATMWCINSYIKKGKQFIYLRRYGTEFNDNADWKILTFFDYIIENNEFPEYTLEVSKNGKFYIYKTALKENEDFNKDDYIAGYYIALSQQRSYRSVAFPRVNKIVFDEFIIDRAGRVGYIKNEAFQLLEFINTVFRQRKNCRVLMIGNSFSVVNPHFTFYKIKPNTLQDITRFNFDGATHCIYRHTSEGVKNAVLETPQGKLYMSVDDYGKYAIDNDFYNDKDSFIELRSSKSEPMFTIQYEGRFIGFWMDRSIGNIYCSYKYDPTKPMYAISTSDHDENTLLIKSAKRTHYLPLIINAFEVRALRFDNQNVKIDVYEILDNIR